MESQTMTAKTKTYEAMFLLDSGVGDFETAAEPIRKVLDRNQAEVLAMKPWDERRLAYEIRGRKRGLYVLTYFRADPARIAEIEHDCHLSEAILRALILRRDRLTDEQVQAETPITSGSRRLREARPDDSDDRRSDDRRRRRPEPAAEEQPPAEEGSEGEGDEQADDSGPEDRDDAKPE